MVIQKLAKRSVEKIVHHYLDSIVRHNAHDDPKFSTDLVGVRLSKTKTIFESVAGTSRRHDMSLVGELIRVSEAMKSIYGADIKELIQKNHQNQLILQIEWMTRMNSKIAQRQLHYVCDIQQQFPFFAHMTTVTLGNYRKNTIPVQFISKEGILPIGEVEIIALGKQDPFTWIQKEFPRRAVFVPVLKGGTSPKALRYALDILKTTLHTKNKFSLFALLRVLAEISSCTKELIMAAEEINLEIPELSELAQEDSFLDPIAIAVENWRKESYEKGQQEGQQEGRQEGLKALLKTASLMLAGKTQGLEAFNDIALLQQEIQRRFAILQTEKA